MEAVKVKKPKTKTRESVPTPTRNAPPIPHRGAAVVGGHRLPDVPSELPGTSAEVERSSSPEPEEIVIEEEPPVIPPRPSIERPIEVVSGSEVPPPLPPRNLIFPRVATGSRKTTPVVREAPPLPSKERLIEVEPTPISADPVSTSCYPSLPDFQLPTVDAGNHVLPPPPYAQLAEQVREISKQPIPRVPQMEAPPMYPALNKMIFEKNKHGLLSEQHLLTFYHNPMYDDAEEFVERFITSEEMPSGPLFPYLKRLKEVCEHIQLSELAEKENTDNLRKCMKDCWIMQEKTISFKGKCGEDRDGTGIGKYTSATISGEKMDEMRRMLYTNRSILLNQRLSQEVEFRSLGLQIQWRVIQINQIFMSENNLTQQSPQTLLQSAINNTGRDSLRQALSDIFYHLRFHALPKRYLEAVTSWATELVSVLNMWCRSEDAQFILCHLLRLPSPISEWAAPLVQTFAASQTSQTKLKIDHAVAMLNYLMVPIKNRDEFLHHVGQSEKQDQSWAILSDDDSEESEFSFVTINELDLVSLLEQLPISDFYSLAFLQFSTESTDKSAHFLSLVSFQLLLMKILSDGLTTYGTPQYKQFCKQIGMSLRQSVRELCSHWRVTRSVLNQAECEQLQREVDRIVLLAVQYIIQHENLGLWQFLVDIPYDCLSEECRVRCDFLLRSTTLYTVKEVYDILLPELTSKLSNAGLSNRIEKVGAVDSVFLLNSLSAITSYSIADPSKFVREIVEMCFCEESSREDLYKVGGEALAQLIERKPTMLDSIIGMLDRKMDAMGEYAVNSLSSSLLSSCRIGESVLGSIVGKWIINRPPDHPANRLGRRLLASLNWGYDESGQMWMDTRVHQMCADTVVKAHSAHCGKSNGLIAKSIQKVAKLASKIPDYEHHFNQFVWDILMKLKLPVSISTTVPQTDLAAFFVHLTQHSLARVDQFLDKGINYLNELITAGCSTAAVVIVCRLLQAQYMHISVISTNQSFMEIFDRIIHVDQCSYAIQLLTGPSSTPTPIVRLICSAIGSCCKTVADKGEFLRAWTEVLCVRRVDAWNTDPVSLQILGTIVRLAFQYDTDQFLGLKDMFNHLYMQMMSSWRDTSKGFLSMFSADQPPPPLIHSTYYGVAPWATFLLLMVEQDSYPTFYQPFFDSLGKKDKTTVEMAAKKAGSKSSIHLTSDRIHVYRWMEFVGFCKESPVLPLVVQQLVICLFTMWPSNGKKQLFARKLVNCSSCTKLPGIVSGCKHTLEGMTHDKGYYKAVAEWIFSRKDVSAPGFDFGQFDLDYLLQMVMANDKNVWMDFVDLVTINTQIAEEEKLYPGVCHNERRPRATPQWDGTSTREKVSRALAFPTLPIHPGLPAMPKVEMPIMFDQQKLLQMFSPFVHEVNKLSSQFVNVCDEIEEHDGAYCKLLTELYKPIVQNIPIEIRCWKCSIPGTVAVQVNTTEFSTTTDAKMSQNREQRGTIITSLQASVLDNAALQTASMEYISGQAALLGASCSPSHRQNMQMTGRHLFYLITSSIGADSFLFPAATASFEHALRVLGQEFVRFRPEEQQIVMKLVLDGFVLSDPLVEVFTPECLSAAELCDAYARMSDAVTDPERSPRALNLMSRLAIDRAAASLPPQQFAALMPLAFNNVASQPDPSTPLHQLCLSHLVTFVFHKFPLNFTSGLDLALTGCNTGVTPVALFEAFVEKLGADKWENARGEYTINGITALECCVVTTKRLREARSQLNNMFTIWAKYLDSVSRLAQCFIHTSIRETYHADMPESVIRNAMIEAFGRITSLFSPLIAPVSPSVPPFSPSHDEQASMLVERMVQNINALPYNTSLSLGQQNVQSLVWQFFCERLSTLTHGTVHYYALLERYLVRIHWSSFWPSLRALQAIDDILNSRSADCFPLVAQIFVRISWKDVLDRHVPSELRPSYLSTLFSVLTRLVSKQQSYIKVRASLVELLKQLTHRTDWKSIDPESCEKIGATLAELLPHDSLANPNDVVAVYLSLWRQVCEFHPAASDSSAPILIKQSAFVRTELRLILRGGQPNALNLYNGLMADCTNIGKTQANLRSFCVVARELTAIWSKISDIKMGETLVSGFTTYLAANPTSPLVLCALHSLVESINADQMVTALKVMERTIRTYFIRTDSSWTQLFEWCSFPSARLPAIQGYLLTLPNSENKISPLLLTLRVVLDYGVQPDALFMKTIDFITGVKPKYIDCEASFLVLFKRVIQWICDKYVNDTNANNEALYQLLRWFPRGRGEEKGGFLSGIISSKKNHYSQKLRVLLHIVELYLTQQSVSNERKPRLKGTDPVMNSRLAALKELAGQKSSQSLAAAFNLCTSYFVSVEDYTILNAPQLVQKLANLLFKDRFVNC